MDNEREMSGIFANNDLGVGATRQEQIDAGVSYMDTPCDAANKVTQYRLPPTLPMVDGGHGPSVLPLFFGVAVLFVGLILAVGYFSKYGVMALLGLAMSGLITVPVMIAIAIKRWPVVRQHLKKIGLVFLAGYVLGMILGPFITLAAHIYTIYLLLKCKPMRK